MCWPCSVLSCGVHILSLISFSVNADMWSHHTSILSLILLHFFPGVLHLHTMSLLQAYQADLLSDLDEGEGIGPDTVCELRQVTDLSLRATKETARSIGRSMAALVATERHLWLNLSNIKGKDKHFLMDAPLSSSGLFGDAVNLVVERFQESAKQVAAFQKLLPRRIHIYRKRVSNTHRGGPPADSGNGTRSESSVKRKGAIEYVPHSNRETGFYSRYFISPKKDGGCVPF